MTDLMELASRMEAGEGRAQTIARTLTDKEKAAIATLPLCGWTPHRVFVGVGRNVSHSSTWRKSTKHREAMRELQVRGVVEQTESRGETLWRLTKPCGQSVKRIVEGLQ